MVDLKKIMAAAVVRRALTMADDCPERCVRNLVDLAAHTGRGDFQRKFFAAAQQMLSDEESAYYRLVENLVRHVDRETLAVFGVNLGYNSCSAGARTIRAIEGEAGFNIPWALTLRLGEAPGLAPWEGLLVQGQALGIFTYLLYAPRLTGELLDLCRRQGECAICLFLTGPFPLPPSLAGLDLPHNLMLLLPFDREAPAACAALRAKKALYSLYQVQSPGMEGDLEETAAAMAALHPACAVLDASPCPPEVQRAAYGAVLALRAAQRCPALVLDLRQDFILADTVISQDPSLAWVDQGGLLRDALRPATAEGVPVFQTGLREALAWCGQVSRP